MDGRSPLGFRLLNEFQRGFPLSPRPYAAVAECLGVSEAEVLATLASLREQGAVSRVGAVFAPRRAGASTLAAMAVPLAELERIAELVNRYPEVNHNYQREHRYNLWFVATAEDEAALDAALCAMAAETGCDILRLPLLEEYHIDLGFDLEGRRASRSAGPGRTVPDVAALSDTERALLRALQEGLELAARPYSRLALRASLTEQEVLRSIEAWLACGFIKRFGVVVRHHELGYAANAMCVWDVPDAEVAPLGERLGLEPAVTLCYRRARAAMAADWPFNLFCMIHGRSRAEVEAEVAELCARHGLARYPQAVLFSLRRFKQRGARYVHSAAHA